MVLLSADELAELVGRVVEAVVEEVESGRVVILIRLDTRDWLLEATLEQASVGRRPGLFTSMALLDF